MHRKVGAVTDTDLINLIEQVIGGITGEHIGQPRLNTHPHEREEAFVDPLGLGRELFVAEFHPGAAMRIGGVRPRQTHRGVEVVAAGIERAGEDRHDEAWVDEIRHMRDLVGAARFGDRVSVTGVEFDPAEAFVGDAIAERSRAGGVVVGDHPGVEEVATRGDQCRGGSHSPGAYRQDAHGHDRPSSSGWDLSQGSPDLRLAIPDRASSTTRLPSRAVMSAWSYGGDTSTTSIPSSGTR